jgi:hypothetical protein
VDTYAFDSKCDKLPLIMFRKSNMNRCKAKGFCQGIDEIGPAGVDGCRSVRGIEEVNM